ncbi:hypothetical protein H0G86_009299 [Trichoderma simmonsii]|uniref:Uncharacterized protein n=1 Tax=Trichoderma simmonsii TaxID=1491479 RepID=A0A8G0LHA1_9HYPO|nr:hypothetical protein H0G86_009299 [Trichoderma simmonsii]
MGLDWSEWSPPKPGVALLQKCLHEGGHIPFAFPPLTRYEYWPCTGSLVGRRNDERRRTRDEKRIQQSGMIEAGHVMLNREGKASQRTAWSTRSRTSHHRLFPPSACLPATEFPAPCTSSHAVLVPVMYLL